MVSEKMTGNVRVVRSKHPEPILTDNEIVEMVHQKGLSVEGLGVWAYIKYLVETGKENFTMEDIREGLWSSDPQVLQNGYDFLIHLGYIQE